MCKDTVLLSNPFKAKQPKTINTCWNVCCVQRSVISVFFWPNGVSMCGSMLNIQLYFNVNRKHQCLIIILCVNLLWRKSGFLSSLEKTVVGSIGHSECCFVSLLALVLDGTNILKYFYFNMTLSFRQYYHLKLLFRFDYWLNVFLHVRWNMMVAFIRKSACMCRCGGRGLRGLLVGNICIELQKLL